MKKLNQLESMRSSINDYSNISKEILGLRKGLQAIKSKILEQKQFLDRINEGVKETTTLIDGFFEKHKNDTEGERSEHEKIQADITKINDEVNEL